MDLVNAILAYTMAGAFVFWIIAENQEESPRLLRFVSAAILALLFAGEERDYHWWISCFVLIGLAAEVSAFASALIRAVFPSLLP